MELTKEFNFSIAHILENYPGECVNLHGHTYKLLITVESDILEDGIVIDFVDFKDIVNKRFIEKIDHSFAYNTESKDAVVLEIANTLKKNDRKVYECNFRTTCEMFSIHIFNLLKEEFAKLRINLKEVKLYEGSRSYSVYKGGFFKPEQ